MAKQGQWWKANINVTSVNTAGERERERERERVSPMPRKLNCEDDLCSLSAKIERETWSQIYL
jgi:hypothetical protein